MEVAISQEFHLAGQRVKDTNFRKKYGASIIAIHRNRQRLNEKIGSIELHDGDVLLILSEPAYVQSIRENKDFYLLSRHKTSIRFTRKQTAIIFGTFIGMILLASLQIFSMFQAALITSGCPSIKQVCDEQRDHPIAQLSGSAPCCLLHQYRRSHHQNWLGHLFSGANDSTHSAPWFTRGTLCQLRPDQFLNRSHHEYGCGRDYATNRYRSFIVEWATAMQE